MPRAGQLIEPLRGPLARYPALPLLVIALGLLVALIPASGGYFVTSWGPTTLVLVGLAVVGALALRRPAPPPVVSLAALLLALYAAWSYLSIAWASQRADAWNGANRTALYAVVFALFVLWRPRARAAALLLGGYAFAVGVVAAVELLHAHAHPAAAFLDGRLVAPVGYANANVALWAAAFIPGVTLAAQRAAPALVRGLLVACSVVLGSAALLGESRGWLFAAPIALLVLVAVSRSRIRTTLTLLLCMAAVAAIASPLLHVYASAGRADFDAAARAAVRDTLVAALVAGLIAGVAAAIDRRLRAPARAVRATAAVLLALGALAAATGLVAVSVREGSPWGALSKAWGSFKHSAEPQGGSSHFSQSLGSNRYDFWRVAWGRFESAPLVGIGADNFQEAYLARSRSDEEPRYPHSVELRALSQTGLIGSALLAGALVAAGLAALRATRRRSALGAAAAAGALVLFVYWFVHGSVDWLWEVPGLGAPAFAFLGLAAALLPRAPARARRSRPGIALAVVAVGGAVALGASIALPWLAARDEGDALAVWRANPSGAYKRLDAASSLNPLSPEPAEVAGNVAIAERQPARAERYFRQALRREPNDESSHLLLGAIVADSGRRAEGRSLLRAAVALNPRDPIATAALRRFEAHRPVDVEAIINGNAARTVALTR